MFVCARAALIWLCKNESKRHSYSCHWNAVDYVKMKIQRNERYGFFGMEMWWAGALKTTQFANRQFATEIVQPENPRWLISRTLPLHTHTSDRRHIFMCVNTHRNTHTYWNHNRSNFVPRTNFSYFFVASCILWNQWSHSNGHATFLHSLATSWVFFSLSQPAACLCSLHNWKGNRMVDKISFANSGYASKCGKWKKWHKYCTPLALAQRKWNPSQI